MRWRPTTEHPPADSPSTALLAHRDSDGDFVLMGIYAWDGQDWRDELSWRRLIPGECYWCPESELLDTLRFEVVS